MSACLCCGRNYPTPGARVTDGPIHYDCWMEHHSSPTESHGCPVDAEEA